MKKLLCFIALVILAFPVLAQDTLTIEPLPIGNINEVLNGDTLSNGQRAHSVYILKRGSVYLANQPMTINGSIKLISPGDVTKRPGTLALAILENDTEIDHFFDIVGKGSKVELDSIYLASWRPDQRFGGWNDGFRLQVDSINFIANKCVFDGFSHTAIQVNAHWNKFNIQNCVFRNEMHPTSYFAGGAFLSGSPIVQDTTIFKNNTFFCNNSYLWGVRGYCPYSLVDHNTFVYGTVNPFLMRQGPNMHLTNNLFYSMEGFGGYPSWIIGGSFLNFPDTSSSSLIFLRGEDSTSYWAKLWKVDLGGGYIRGSEVYVDAAHGVTPDMVATSNRVFELKNNVYFWPQKLFDFIKAYNDTTTISDSVAVPRINQQDTVLVLKRRIYYPTWINEYMQYSVDSILVPGGASIDISNNTETDPGFNTNINNQVDKQIAYVHKIAIDVIDSAWHYNPTGTLYPPVWPLPENLRYTNTSLMNAGTDGKALGDLNWFPEQMVVGINDVPVTPVRFALHQNYPNPFNPSTKISFNLDKSGFATLTIYNILGQKVATLISGNLSAGVHEVNFNASSLSSGIYMYKLESGSNVAVRKMMLLK